MDIIFNCHNCKQQLEAETSLSGTSIACPACGVPLIIPDPDPAIIKTSPSSNSAPKEEKHFVVPVTDKPTESLIQKPRPPLDIAAKKSDGTKSLRVKCVRHTDCIEVGKDRFDEIVSDYLAKIGEENVVSINTFTYSHIDLGTRQLLTDYGVMIVYKG
jgi:DNA-directed RNA polymerase subunit RPC12/RpoP